MSVFRSHGIEARRVSAPPESIYELRAANQRVAFVVIPNAKVDPSWRRFNALVRQGYPVFRVPLAELPAFAASWTQRSVRQLGSYRVALRGHPAPPI